jgi:hypothetical protein
MTYPLHHPSRHSQCNCIPPSETYDDRDDYFLHTELNIRVWGPIGTVFLLIVAGLLVWAGLYGWLGDGFIFSDDHDSRLESSAFCGVVGIWLIFVAIGCAVHTRRER